MPLHLIFAEDAHNTLWTSTGEVGPGVVGWLDRKMFEETGDEQKSQGWTPFILDTNGNGKRDEYVEPGQPVDASKDARVARSCSASVLFWTTAGRGRRPDGLSTSAAGPRGVRRRRDGECKLESAGRPPDGHHPTRASAHGLGNPLKRASSVMIYNEKDRQTQDSPRQRS